MLKDTKTSNLRLKLAAGLAVATAFGLASAGASAQTGFTTIDVTGAGTGAQQGTAVTSVDAAGDIAGVYIDTNNALHCFVLPAGGSIANCDVTGAGSSVGEGTFPTSINTSGVVAGSYIDASQISHGFVRAVNGTITKFDAPLASQSKNRGTTVLSINDSGVIIGTYTTGTYSTTSVYGGFMRSADGTTYTTINDPNEGTSEDANGKKQGTTPVAMNASGVIAGYYIDSTSVQHGFVRSASGTYTQIDPTGAGTCVNQNNGSNFGGTTASGIDAAGDVVGTYLNTSCAQQGFIRNASGTITSFDVPGAASSPCTTNGGSGEKICVTFLVLSDAVGDLTGSYIDTNGTIHGFLRPTATGIFTSFDDPNAGTSGSLNGTLGIAINSRTSGIEIAGSYIDANSVLHGFNYSPALTATTTTLTPVPTPNPSIYQEPVTLTAAVTSSGGTPANGESVTFMSGTTSLGTAQLTSGTASLTTTDLPVGTDSFTAVYDGDSGFAGSTSVAVSQTVNKASSSTTLTSSLNPSNSGQSVTLTANISGQFSGVATGTVTFSNGSSSLGSATVSSNMASLATTALPAGTDSITAAYSGDSNFTGSSSSTLSQVVNVSTQAATPTFLPVAGIYTAAQSVTISDTTPGATIYYTTNGTTPTTGSTVYSNSSPIAVSSSETIEAIATASGYTTSAIATAAYTIQAPGFTLLASPGSVSVAQGSSATINVTVTDVEGFSGSVTLSASGLPSGVTASTATSSPAGTQGIILSAGSSAAATSSPVTVTLTGTSGALSASTTIALTITGQTGSIFDNIANPCSPYSQTQPSCGYYPVFGPTGDFAVPFSDYAAAQFTPSASGMATDARITVVQDEPGPGLGASGLLNVAIFSDANGLPGTQIGQTVTGVLAPYCCNSANLTAWFSQSVSLDAGVPYWLVLTPGASDTYVAWEVGGLSPVPTSQSLSAGETPQPCNTWCAFASSNVQFAIDSGTAPPPGFMLSASPTTLSVPQGGSITSTITATDEGAFSGAVVLTSSGLPSGVTASFAAGSAAGTQVLTLSASSSAAVTSSPATVTIAGTSGSLSAITAVAISVTASGANVTATPTFSPDAGTYTAAQSVTISDTTPGATIYYTTNGTTPTTSSTVYSGPITVSASETLEAIATASGYSTSAVGTAAYTINNSVPQAATPTFSPAAGTYTSAQSVAISDGTSGATIYYTTNGATPTTSSPVYSGPITVSSSETLEAIATASGNSQSAVASATYTINLSILSAGEWTWIGGSNKLTCGASDCGQAGVYGTLGTAAAGNFPGGRDGAATWTDNNGNLWLFGGGGLDASGNAGILNDLWEFNPSTNEWAWMGGSSTVPASCAGSTTEPCGQPGVYGTLETPGAGNIPGGRFQPVSWTDKSGNLWLSGGAGFDSGNGSNDANRELFLNDVWEYTPSTGQWAWMGGSSSMTCASPAPDYCGQSGVYGALGTPAVGNIPGGRYGATSSTDKNGNFWLFGGYGEGAGGACCYLNDLWEFNPTTNRWTWMSGGSGSQQAGVYGTEGTPAAGNVPGSHYFANSWIDGNGNFWLYGGYGFDALNTGGYLDDLWEFNPSTGYWTWSGGSNSASCWSSLPCPTTAIYGTLGVPAAGNLPGNRSGASGWTDKSGNFWLFGSNAWRASGSSVINENLNDLWALNPSSQEWAWMSGSSTPNHDGVYGALGTPAAANDPGGRTFASSWTDASGNLWLFGGEGLDSGGITGDLNDLWEYKLQAIPLQAPTPTFSVPGGTYTSAQTVTISDTLTGATIYYTTNGTTPTTSSTAYSGPVSVSSSETIEAIAAASGYSNSAVASATYTINNTLPQAATPTFSPVAGTYTAAQSVTISDTTPGATIYYTINGTTPTTGSTVYSSSSPIAVSSSETIEALAAATGYSNSAVGSAAYVINIPGFGPPSGFQPGSISIQPGASTGNTATISVVGTNGFSGTVNLSCSITPVAANDPPTCTLSPPSVTLSGTTTQTSTLTVTSTAATSALIRPAWRQAGGIAFAVVLMFAIPRRRRSWLAMLILLAVVGSIGIAGCGGGSGGGGGGGNSGTTAGTYTIKVTGTSGSTSATITTVTLTVQ